MPNIFSNDLMERVLIPNMDRARRFKVLSGFVSAEFLSEITKLYPQVVFEVYVGMASQGITLSELSEFRKIAQRDKVTIYLQNQRPLTHIKAYEWEFSDGTSRTMTGSANFSTNGFITFHEMLAESDFDIDQLISESGQFVDVRDLEAMDLVTINPVAIESNDGENELEKKVLKFWIEQHASSKKQSDYVSLFRLKKKENRYNNAIDVPVMSFRENNEGFQILQARAGRTKDMELFPLSESFSVLTDDGVRFLMRRTGLFGKQITPENFDLGRYLKQRLSIEGSDRISEEYLTRYGRNSIKFYATTEDDYFLFDFSISE